MSTFPWLLALLVVPLIGAAIVMFLPKNSPALAKQFGLLVSLIVFALTVGMALQFVTAQAADFQFTYSFSWIPAFGVNFALGVDGIALVLIAMAACLVPVVLTFFNLSALDTPALGTTLKGVLLLGGLCASRFGLWAFDLTQSQIMQERVEPTQAGVING